VEFKCLVIIANQSTRAAAKTMTHPLDAVGAMAARKVEPMTELLGGLSPFSM
jgi:hypothetical protein